VTVLCFDFFQLPTQHLNACAVTTGRFELQFEIRDA
jgi:hypothetical protein